MILRKPYAFLIKNFKKINILIFILTVFVFTKTTNLIGFVKTYSQTGIYNELDLISNYINISFIGPILIILALSSVLLYLLKYKDKPIKAYLFTIIEYFILIILLIYANSFFNDVDLNGFNRQQALLLKDMLTVVSIPQYPLMLILFIRSIGLDLKSFGFNEDKEFLASEEDREEVEVDAHFNKDKYKRNIKKTLRETKYFVLENKVYLSIIFVVLTLFTGFYVYKNIYLKNKIYGMNSNISSNYYTLNIKNSYITTRDYKGDTIDDASSFVILDVDIRNNLGGIRKMELNRFMLYVDDRYYVPDTSYDNYFKDMGDIYHGQDLIPGNVQNYFIVFKIDKPKEDANFLLRYQDVIDKGNLIRIKLNIKDISPFILKDSKSFLEELNIPINLNNNTIIKINDFSVSKNASYNYVKCDRFNNCPVYQNTISVPDNKRILVLKFYSPNKSKSEIISFVKNYGKIRYKVGDKTYLEKINDAVDVSYYGNYLYYTLPSNVENANSLEIVFTVRSYQYIYKLI